MRIISDLAEIQRACQVLFEPGQVVELRALECKTRAWPRPHTVAGYFDNPEKLTSAAAGLDARGVYITLNPLQPALLARAANHLVDVGQRDPLTSDGDVLARRWLPIDCDPVRPAGISASDAEHELALARARAIREHLAAAGWPAALLADSGNGAHLLYRIDLPAADDGLISRVLEALAARFDDAQVAIDRKVGNPARIWKLYGTVAAKGDHTADRPHRVSRLVDAPAEWGVAGRALLEAEAARPSANERMSRRMNQYEPRSPDGMKTRTVARSETGHSGKETGHSGKETGHSGKETGHSGKETGHSGKETGHNGKETSHSGSETGHSGSETGHNGSETGHSGNFQDDESQQVSPATRSAARGGSRSASDGRAASAFDIDR